MLKDARVYRRLLLSIVFAALLVLTLGAGVYAAPASIGPRTHYLALGDSLAFGFQPNHDFSHGYATDFLANLQTHGVQDIVNLGCPGESSVTMLQGGCPASPSTPAQLRTAFSFLLTHPGQVSPVTLDIGANDLLHDSDARTCTINLAQFNSDLLRLDLNLNSAILPLLKRGLTVNGRVTGDLFLLNYYDPIQNICPNLLPFTQELNQHLAHDAQGFATIVDVFDAFGGAHVPNPNICNLTWICSSFHDIHATNSGYQVIANTIEATAKY